ncbi:MAG: hypothetical protein AAF696_04575 [Bacteroidota bacterium]
MNSERIILANFENIQEANHYAKLLNSEGISCEIDSFAKKQSPNFGTSSSFQLCVEAKDELMARILISSDDPWFLPQVQTPIAQQYLLAGAILTFVGVLCSFLTIKGSIGNKSWIWIPLLLAILGLGIFATGIKKSSKNFGQDHESP